MHKKTIKLDTISVTRINVVELLLGLTLVTAADLGMEAEKSQWIPSLMEDLLRIHLASSLHSSVKMLSGNRTCLCKQGVVI